ncbi:MAG: hypothetical protein K9I34_01355 [Bacteroidales bacterium]|nr:hypothetical protein [Bacteroidales bacterium]
MNYKWIFLTLFASLLILSACNSEDPDPCDATAASQKVINSKATITIASTTGIPVENEYVNFTITSIACNGQEIVRDFSDSTDSNGQIESDICNFVLNNTKDKIVFYAVAPNLTNFIAGNFHQIIVKYDELDGIGLEEFDLIITTENNK